MHVYSLCLWRPEGASDPLELELTDVSFCVLAGNQTQVIWESSALNHRAISLTPCYVLYWAVALQGSHNFSISGPASPLVCHRPDSGTGF